MKISFIGCGNMGSAIIGGLIANGTVKPGDITASDRSDKARTVLADKTGACTVADNRECVNGADVVVFAVKPNVLPYAAADVKDVLTCDQLIISIAAGRSLAFLEDALGEDRRIVRVMPNTPALVGEGISGWCANAQVTPEDKETVKTILTSFGEAEEVPESMMNVVTSVSGSSPAYVFSFIEAMADAAVLDGMPRSQAYHFAAQTVLGSAKMVLETGKHPGELKDMVCSPGGTTIEGVRVLEERGFRGTVIEAVHACTEKSKRL